MHAEHKSETVMRAHGWLLAFMCMKHACLKCMPTRLTSGLRLKQATQRHARIRQHSQEHPTKRPCSSGNTCHTHGSPPRLALQQREGEKEPPVSPSMECAPLDANNQPLFVSIYWYDTPDRVCPSRMKDLNSATTDPSTSRRDKTKTCQHKSLAPLSPFLLANQYAMQNCWYLNTFRPRPRPPVRQSHRRIP